MSRPRPRLGRGLESLIPISPEGQAASADGLPQFIAIDQIVASTGQQRTHFAQDQLRELSSSIKEHGLLQPLLVRRLPEGYELIAGERRWRAAQMAGLTKIPAIIRSEVDSGDSLLLGLIENLQREDLNPIEEAQGIRKLIDSFGLTHEEAAARLGKHRVAVSQALRLLSGCPALVSATASGAISAGHARALVGLPGREDQELGLKAVVAKRLSVRQTEQWVQSYSPPARRPRPPRPSRNGYDEWAQRLHDQFGDHVAVRGSADSGRITLTYKTAEERQRLVNMLAPVEDDG
ncbi:MAG TPA: ParB/RepB/Spo0J family partition protein [Candidatus Dormibacteraeota bacterium]|jgi:ParB family chromosome partitioning protein|nr:ParB/RepB/Spo0J family partition protein [Candidatus Dormibacteraeota bacterium]